MHQPTKQADVLDFGGVRVNKKMSVAAKTRKNLMDAFWILYCEKRMEKITVREITDKAGYNRGTFYEYFTDVYHLLDELEKELIPDLHELPQFTLANTGTVGMPMDSFFSFYNEKSQYYSVLLGAKGDPGFAPRLKNSLKPILIGLVPLEKQGMLETDYALEFILSAMVGILGYWHQNGQNIAEDKLVKLIHSISQNGFFSVLQ